MRRIDTLLGVALVGATALGAAWPAKAQSPMPTADTAAVNLGPIGEGRRDWLKWNCYSCHGQNASGGMGPNVQHAERGDLGEAVLGGVPESGMPAYHRYATSADIINLGAYLGSIGTASEPKWVDWWNPIPGLPGAVP